MSERFINLQINNIPHSILVGELVTKIKITHEGYKCERCGHEWIPRNEAYPRVCPRCKSPYWDRPKKG